MVSGKDKARNSEKSELRAAFWRELLLLLAGCGSGLGSLGFHQPLLEFVNAAGGIHELLLAGVKRMADVADADDNDRPGGARLDHVAAGATDFRIHIFRMNVRLHKRGLNITMNLPDDKREFTRNGLIFALRGRHGTFSLISVCPMV